MQHGQRQRQEEALMKRSDADVKTGRCDEGWSEAAVVRARDDGAMSLGGQGRAKSQGRIFEDCLGRAMLPLCLRIAASHEDQAKVERVSAPASAWQATSLS